MQITTSKAISKQQGATLVIALVILLVMTFIGIAAMKSSTLQERMAGNARQKTIAKNAAETALRVAEDWLDQNVKSTLAVQAFDGTDGLFSFVPRPGGKPPKPLDVDLSEDESWDGLGIQIDEADLDDAVIVKLSPDKISSQPKFVIEYIGRDLQGTGNKPINILDADDNKEDDEPYFFRITAIGWARDRNIYSVLESTYRTGYGTDAAGNEVFTY